MTLSLKREATLTTSNAIEICVIFNCYIGQETYLYLWKTNLWSLRAPEFLATNPISSHLNNMLYSFKVFYEVKISKNL